MLSVHHDTLRLYFVRTTHKHYVLACGLSQRNNQKQIKSKNVVQNGCTQTCTQLYEYENNVH